MTSFTNKLTKSALALGAFASIASATLLPVLASSTTNEEAALTGGALLFTYILVGSIYIVIPLIICVSLVVQIILIVDVVQRDFGNEANAQLLWILILLFVGFPIGSVLYYYLVMKKYPKKA